MFNSLPNLLIVGAAKSGTTSLHNYLNQHPEVFMSNLKEPHFLIINKIGKQRILNGITNIINYKELFSEADKYKYRGESSVMYLLFHEISINKIKHLLGDKTKIIIMLRNPVERAYSGYQHVKRFNIQEDVLDFKTAWDISEKRYFENKEMTPASRYQELGLYYKQVEAFLKQIKNVHIIIYDDYKKNLEVEMKKVFDFIGVERIKINTEKRHMVGGWQWENEEMKKLMMQKSLLKKAVKILIPFKGIRKKIREKIQKENTSQVSRMNNDDRKMLNEFYKEDVKKLSELIGRDLNYWVQ